MMKDYTSRLPPQARSRGRGKNSETVIQKIFANCPCHETNEE